MCWGPPWLLAILAPLLELPFDVAARCWFLMNDLFLMVAASVTARIYCPGGHWVASLAGMVSPPAFYCLQLGQISLVLAVGLTLVLVDMERHSPAAGRLGLALLTVKRCVRFCV